LELELVDQSTSTQEIVKRRDYLHQRQRWQRSETKINYSKVFHWSRSQKSEALKHTGISVEPSLASGWTHEEIIGTNIR
jgi:hypothetical protein